MKKILLLTVAALAAVVSCDKGNVTPEVRDSFVASVDYVGSKTVMGEIDAAAGTATMYWNGTEAIRVMGANNSVKEYEANVEGNALTATFVAKPGDATLSGDNYLALYPAAPAGGVIWSGNVADPAVKLWLPNKQALVADTYEPSTHIAVAYTAADNKTLSFKNVTSLIRFTVGNENVVNPVFYTNGGEYIAGNFNLYYNDGTPLAVVPEDASVKESAVKYIGSLEKGKAYYFSVLPEVLETGFTFEVMIEGQSYTKPYKKSIELKRNNVLDLGTITFETQTVTYKDVYFKPHEGWKANGEKFAAWSWTSGEGSWYAMADSDSDGIYEGSVPENMENIIFVNIPSDAVNPPTDWNSKVYQTVNLTFDGECFASDYTGINGSWMTLEASKTYAPVNPETRTIYFKPKDWAGDPNAWFEAWRWGAGDAWSSAVKTSEAGIYTITVPSGTTGMKLFRKGPEHASNQWESWNETGDIDIPKMYTGLNCFSIDGWSYGSWSTYTPAN